MTKGGADKWVEKATADEIHKQVLQRAHSEKGMTVATDGYRLHAINEGQSFPDFKEMIQREIPREGGVTISVDPRYLRDALPEGDECKGPVVLRVLGPGKPVEIGWTGKGGKHFYAMIMPLERPWKNDTKIPWRPVDIDAVAEAETIAADEEE